MTGFGFFVRLNDLFIDGLVHVSTLDNDYYRYDNVGQRLIGESSSNVYRLGDEVEIRVEAVHMDERTIDFALISTTRRARNEGKTARTRAKAGRKGISAGTVRKGIPAVTKTSSRTVRSVRRKRRRPESPER